MFIVAFLLLLASPNLGFASGVDSKAVNAGARCDLIFYDLAKVETYQGIPLTKDNGFSAAPKKGDQRFILGSGVGGEVVRVHDSNTGKTHIEKTYFDDAVFKNDLLALDFLNQAFAKNPSQLISPVQVRNIDPKYRRLVLDDAKGSDIARALRDSQDPAQAAELQALYSRGLTEVYRAISKMETRRPLASLHETDQYYLEFIKLEPPMHNRQGSLRAILTLYPANYGKTKSFRIYLKADNVLIQADRSLKIIDPY